ncbi:UNVERIFIED_CONTAM: hypothetical protein K2H54_031680 [Gekko kuhli]
MAEQRDHLFEVVSRETGPLFLLFKIWNATKYPSEALRCNRLAIRKVTPVASKQHDRPGPEARGPPPAAV